MLLCHSVIYVPGECSLFLFSFFCLFERRREVVWWGLFNFVIFFFNSFKECKFLVHNMRPV